MAKKNKKIGGVAGKLQELADLNFEIDGTLPVLEKGSPEWSAWLSWRRRNGLSTGFMLKQPRWTVASEVPPDDLNQLEALIKRARQRAGGRGNVNDVAFPND